MLDFCGEHGITCEIERISMDYVNTAMERVFKSDVHYRECGCMLLAPARAARLVSPPSHSPSGFVLDIQNTLVA